MHITSI